MTNVNEHIELDLNKVYNYSDFPDKVLSRPKF
jgi:hypothetical protein